MTNDEEMAQASKLENDFHRTERPGPIQTFANQNARAKVRLELDNGVLLEVPMVVIMRALHEQWASKMVRTGRHCIAIPTEVNPRVLDEEHDLLFLILTTTPPEGFPIVGKDVAGE